ncbi:RNase3 domain-containing protein [Rhizoctonia solani AG-1 IA]|uniref:RNase3 domain-containing protein n=1 Tax=Thanatephorus cucumeris (strain AG1-IA) TaxID=983506 RepID=L8WQG5_THACA|nr:RNase3 domain-containing protein [Rhizoctonia solani AG-1 IA]
MSLPELPTINPTDQYRVFRHRGADESNEQLSLLGDPILTAVITDWIITNRPTWSPGEVSVRMRLQCMLQVVRTALIKGSSVADWTTMYSLDQHIQTSNANSSLLVRRSQGAQVAVFKAYVAAVYLKGGFSTVRNWMAGVLSSTVDLEKFDHPPSQLV